MYFYNISIAVSYSNLHLREEGFFWLIAGKWRLIMNQAVVTCTPLMRLVNLLEFRWVSPEITNKRFPGSNRIWKDYKVFRFKNNVSSSEIVKKMRSKGYEPANSHELVLWEGHNDNGSVVAFGSPIHIGGYRSALYLDKNGETRDLYLIWWDNPWNEFNRFLAVRELQPIRI